MSAWPATAPGPGEIGERNRRSPAFSWPIVGMLVVAALLVGIRW